MKLSYNFSVTLFHPHLWVGRAFIGSLGTAGVLFWTVSQEIYLSIKNVSNGLLLNNNTLFTSSQAIIYRFLVKIFSVSNQIYTSRYFVIKVSFHCTYLNNNNL